MSRFFTCDFRSLKCAAEPIPVKKPGPRAPRIPPAQERVPIEVWEDIFDLATYVPALMEIDPAEPFNQPTILLPGDSWDPNILRTSMRLRYSLARVCRTWNAAVTPSLYRCVVLFSSKSVQAFRRTLVAERGTQPVRSMATRTRHLVLTHYVPVPLPGERPHPNSCTADSKSTLYAVQSIIRGLPYLEILSVAKRFSNQRWTPYRRRSSQASPEFPNTFNTLADSRFPALIKLDLSHCHSVRDSEISAMISAAPNLRTFLGPPGLQSCALAIPPLRRLRYILPCNASLCRCNDSAEYEPFPEVTCTSFTVQHSWNSFPSHFLTVQGGNITTAHLRLSLTDSKDLVETAVVQLSAMLPNLTRLHMTLPHWRLEFPFARLPQRVTHLSLRIRLLDLFYYYQKPKSDEQREDARWDALFEGLFDAVHGLATAELGQALEVVRFLDPEVCGAMRTGLHTDDLRMEMAEQVVQAGTPFRFEDFEGREMVPTRSTEEGIEGVVVFA